jgi:hypothetical protein
MADYLTLEIAKQQCNVDNTNDDEIITRLLDVVETAVANELEEDLADLEIESDLPADLIHAMYLLLAHFYANREALIIGVGANIVPLAYKMLILPYKNYTVK